MVRETGSASEIHATEEEVIDRVVDSANTAMDVPHDLRFCGGDCHGT